MNRILHASVFVIGMGVSGFAFAQAGSTGGDPGGAAMRATPNSAPGSTVAPGLPGTPTGHEASQPSPAPSGYATEAEAKQACGSDTVVWGSIGTKKMSASGSSTYGQPGPGAYMCQKQAMTDGYAM